MISKPGEYPERWCRLFIFKIGRLRQTETENSVHFRMAPTLMEHRKTPPPPQRSFQFSATTL
jgi:hypothetical protein